AARSLAGAAGIHPVLAELKPRHGSQGLAYTRSNAGPIRVRAESPSVTRKRAFLNHARIWTLLGHPNRSIGHGPLAAGCACGKTCLTAGSGTTMQLDLAASARSPPRRSGVLKSAGKRGQTLGFAGHGLGTKASDETFDGVVKRCVARPIPRQAARETRWQDLARQLDGVSKMPAGEDRILELFESDPAQRDVHPEVRGASLERVAKRVARLLGITGLPELQALLEVRLHLFDAARMNQLEGVWASLHRSQSDRPGTRARPPTRIFTRSRAGPRPTATSFPHQTTS